MRKPPSPLIAHCLVRTLAAALVCAGLTNASAQALSCSNDGRPQPAALLERFMDAGCHDCWQDARAPQPPKGAAVLDWVLPSELGDEASLSAVALPESHDRQLALKRPDAPLPDSHLTRPQSRHALRVVQGFVVNGYLGAKLSYRPPSAQPYTAWLLLVETLPAGTEGSPVARQLVRAAAELRPATRNGRPAALNETRALRVPEGAQHERLRLLGWVEDAQGRMRALAQTHCAAAP